MRSCVGGAVFDIKPFDSAFGEAVNILLKTKGYET